MSIPRFLYLLLAIAYAFAFPLFLFVRQGKLESMQDQQTQEIMS